MNILTTAEALEAINRRLQRPISRTLFHQSILPLLIERGDARNLGKVTAVGGEWIHAWAAYIAWREAQVISGALPPKYPYNISDMEDHFHGTHD